MSEPEVELLLPAHSAYVAVLRTTACALAARLDFTLEDIDDLRLALSEAATLLLEGAQPQGRLECAFWLREGTLTSEITLRSTSQPAPDLSSFAWTVLSTLAAASCRVTDDGVRITLIASSSLGSTAAS